MLKAKDIMAKNVVTIKPDATLAEAIKMLIAEKISGVPVVNAGGKMVGLISEKDILNLAFSGNLNNTKVEEIMTREVVSFSSDTDIDRIALVIGERQFRRVPIVDGGKVVGIVSRRDIIRNVLPIE